MFPSSQAEGKATASPTRTFPIVASRRQSDSIPSPRFPLRRKPKAKRQQAQPAIFPSSQAEGKATASPTPNFFLKNRSKNRAKKRAEQGRRGRSRTPVRRAPRERSYAKLICAIFPRTQPCEAICAIFNYQSLSGTAVPRTGRHGFLSPFSLSKSFSNCAASSLLSEPGGSCG